MGLFPIVTAAKNLHQCPSTGIFEKDIFHGGTRRGIFTSDQRVLIFVGDF
jgi:hypothetical protein